MKCLIYRKRAAEKPQVYARCETLTEAKKILSDKYYQGIELFFDEIVNGRDKLVNGGKDLHLFDNHYFIEQDKSL